MEEKVKLQGYVCNCSLSDRVRYCIADRKRKETSYPELWRVFGREDEVSGEDEVNAAVATLPPREISHIATF